MKSIVSILTSITIAFASSASVRAEERLTVGVSAPLSGMVAGMGQAFQRGITLFAKEHPAEAAQLKIILDDHRYEGKLASNSCNKLASVDKVDVMVVWGNTPSEICSPIAERLKTPTITISMNPDAKGRSFVATIGPSEKGIIEILVKYFKDLNAKKPAAITIDIGTAVKGVNLTKEGLGGNMDVRLVPGSETDFKTIISVLKQQGVDAVLLFLAPEQALTFAKQAVDLNFLVPFVGGDIFADEAFQSGFTKLLPSLDFVYGAVDSAFKAKVVEQFGDASYIFETAAGYTTMQLLVRLNEHKKAFKLSNILEGLPKIDLGGVPVLASFTNDPSYGVHIETSPTLYQAKKG